MSTYTNIPKIIFDPEIYMSILNQIIKLSNSNHIDIYTIILLNSVYMNEMLDKDIQWQDRTDDEYKIFINDIISNFIKFGVDLIKFNKSTQQSNNQSNNQSTKKSVSFIDSEIIDNDENTLSDLMDSMPIDENDDYYKKVNKLGKQKCDNDDKSVRFI